MSGEAVQIGPFVGGLNTFSDPTAIADNEIAKCENFELDLDGSLVSRPPFNDTTIDFDLGATGNINVLGYYYGPGNVPYLLASNGLDNTYYFDGGSWNSIFDPSYADKFAATSMVQYDNKAWLVNAYGTSQPGGKWIPGSFTDEPNMPKGDVIVSHKDRLWIAGGRDALNNPTRLWYSNTPADINGIWIASPDFADIGTGDGQSIVSLAVYYNSLIIFRTASIYSYQYTSNPDNFVVSLLVPNIGLTDKKALVAWENYIYFMYDDKAYEFVNNRAQQINLKVPFVSTSRANFYQPYTVSLFSNRIIFSFWDVMYVFSIRTRTWTTWKSTVHGPIGTVISAVYTTEFEEALAFSSKDVPSGGSRVTKTLQIVDTVNDNSENFICVLQTKNYNYQTSSAYKRLFWWGVDAIFRGEVRAWAVPITFSYSVTWTQMASFTWTQAANFTWDQPASPDISVETLRNTAGLGAARKFVKFLKAMRFRQIHYKLEFDTSGSTADAPVRVFALMTYVRAHERVSKSVT